MKRLIVFFLLVLSTFTFSQSKFSITLSPSTFFPNSSDFRLGIGGLLSFGYNLNNDFSASITSGYSTWGYNNSSQYNTRVIPVILGLKYNLSESSIVPYISGEFQLISGEIDYLNYFNNEAGVFFAKPVESTKSIFDYGVGLGAGVKFPISSNLAMDFGSSILLTAKNSNIYNIRTSFGLSYLF